MPVVPVIRERQVGSTPVAGTRQGLNVPESAFATPQVDLRGVSAAAQQIIAEERGRADRAMVTDADGDLAALETSILHDPKSGLLNRRGRDAFNLRDTAKEQWDAGKSEISKKLTSTAQREAFERSAVSRWTAVNGAVNTHESAETERFDQQAAESLVANERDAAIKGFNDPIRVRESIDRQKAVMTDWGKDNGMPEEWFKEKRFDVQSKTHAGVLETMMAKGMDRLAAGYFKNHKDEMTAKDATAIDEKLRTATTDGEAIRGVDAVWASLGPKGLKDPVKVASMEEKLRETYKEEPAVIKAAVQELRSRVSAFNAEQSETAASNKATVLKAFNDGMGLSGVKKLPQYLDMSGTDQEQVASYIVDRNYSLGERGYAAANRAEAEKAKKGFEHYWLNSSPALLVQYSDATILAMEPFIGRELTGDLMRQKRGLEGNEAKVREATIDTETFKHHAANADITDTAELGEIKYRVENEIDRAQSALGRQLGRAEKDKIMLGVIDEKVMLSRFFFDKPRIAALVNKNAQGDAYVPIAGVQKDKKWLPEALNWMRSEGIVNGTDEQIIAKYTTRLQRAYALRITGASATEVQDILKGIKK